MRVLLSEAADSLRKVKDQIAVERTDGDVSASALDRLEATVGAMIGTVEAALA